MKHHRNTRRPTYFTPFLFVSLVFCAIFLTSHQYSYADSFDSIDHIIITGQSLANGAFGTPSLSTVQPFNNILLKEDHFAPLTETDSETIGSSMANTISFLTGKSNNAFEVTHSGVNGAWYTYIKKGTETFAQSLNQVIQSQTLAGQEGKQYKVTAIASLHGETDDLYGWGNKYEGYLKEWQQDYQNEINKMTGENVTIPMFIYQLSSYSEWRNVPGVSIAQLSASEDYPDKIILVTPMYFFTYRNGPHLTNYSYRLLGGYFGKVYKQVVIDRKVWTPLSPQRITRHGNIIRVGFYVPSPPLVFDTKSVLERKNYGFEFYQENGNTISIKSVCIINASTVEVILSGIPTGKNQRLRYAYTATSGVHPGAFVASSPAGNLRDSDNTESFYGDKLYNWSVHFDKPILSSDWWGIGMLRILPLLQLTWFSQKLF